MHCPASNALILSGVQNLLPVDVGFAPTGADRKLQGFDLEDVI